MVRIASILPILAATAATVSAHPGEKHDHAKIKRQIVARNEMAAQARRSLQACSGSAASRALMERSVKRRAETLSKLRAKRGITAQPNKFRRDLATLQSFEAINHNETGLVSYTPETDPSVIFSANTSCILAPEVTSGPYYVFGELIRSNVKEDLYCDGVDMYLEVQYIDVNTCEPVENVYVDVWNANATGVYSGIVATGNEAADGWDSTYLRGIQVTDSDGVAAFETIFPGHYEGRATHTHLLAHMNVTVNANDTISGGAVTHIGQLFYPEDLRSAVEATSPYNTNTVEATTNDDDMWTIVQAEGDYDPFPEFVYLGDDITDGLMAWIQIGVDTAADYTDDDYYSIAAYLEEDGGHQNSDSTVGGGNMGGNGTMPSGAMPSGTNMPTDLPTAPAA